MLTVTDVTTRKLFAVVSSLGPTDYNTLHTILAMATYGEDPTLTSAAGAGPRIRNMQPVSALAVRSVRPRPRAALGNC